MDKKNIAGSLTGIVTVAMLLLVFLVAAAVLIKVFCASWEMSTETRQKNDAVSLCRSAAEIFYQNGLFEDVAGVYGAQPDEKVLYFDDQLCSAAREQAVYTMRMDAVRTASGAGELVEGCFSVFCEGESIYSATAQVYLTEAGSVQQGNGAYA